MSPCRSRKSTSFMSTLTVISTAIKELATARTPMALTTAQSWWEQAIHRFLRQRLSLLAALLLIVLSLVAILAPSVAPYDPAEQFRDAGRMGQPLASNARFWLG